MGLDAALVAPTSAFALPTLPATSSLPGDSLELLLPPPVVQTPLAVANLLCAYA